jgi:N-acetylmuramoyl-L-alanine amidase
MGRKILKAVILFMVTVCFVLSVPVYAQKKLLSVTHPPNNYHTNSDKIFFLGTAPKDGQVTIDGKQIDRAANGNFAPTLPLKAGENNFRVRYKDEEIQLKIIKGTVESPRASAQPEEGGEPKFQGGLSLPTSLCVGSSTAGIASNSSSAGATSSDPQAIYGAGQYLGCAVAKATGVFPGKPTSRQAPAARPTALIEKELVPTKIAALPSANANLEVAEVVVENAVTRTGPNSNYSRVTPLPRGTKATVVGRQNGDNNGKVVSFVRLDYGGWVNGTDLQITNMATAPQSIVKTVQSQSRNGHTELRFPLEAAVPIAIEQQEKALKLTLFNTSTQAESLKLTGDQLIQQVAVKTRQPSQVEYTFNFKSGQQWGYKYRYEGNNLVLTLRHPPRLNKSSSQPLSGTKIFIDPGHGGEDSGAVGPNGYTEKEATLFAAKLLGNELVAKGAQVFLSRESDKTVSLDDRRAMVDKIEPTISLSIHYNSLPDGADPNKVKGFSTYWYHAQAQGLANFLHTYVVQYGSRPRYGVTWDNLALARPAAAPSVLLELGFMSNPEEFEWVSNPEAQQQMSKVLANGITQWMMTVN